MNYTSSQELQSNLDNILESPKNNGVLKMISRRPGVNLREVLNTGELSLTDGLIGDSWKERGSRHTPNKTAHPEMQLNIMNARVIALIAREEPNWSLAGDQLFIDMDLSGENLPAGTKLAFGSAEIEITSIPHNGCGKFKERFGSDALKFVNSELGKEHHFRGLNAKVIKPGIINKGDIIRKLNN